MHRMLWEAESFTLFQMSHLLRARVRAWKASARSSAVAALSCTVQELATLAAGVRVGLGVGAKVASAAT